MRRAVPGWVLGVAGAVYAFLHLPVLIIVVFSFNDSKFSADWVGFTLEWYRRLFERPDLLRGLRLSLLVGGISTVVAAVFGTLLALALSRGRRRRGARSLAEGLLYVPVVTPEVVVGVSLLMVFAVAGIPLGIGSITIAHIAFNISFVAIVVLARLEGMDRTLEEAAMVLGADELTAFRRITVPQLWPAILAGGLLAFTMSFDDYVITSFVAGAGSSTLPIVVYGMVRRTVEPSVNAISTLILVVTAVLIFVADRLAQARPPAGRVG